MIIQEEFQLEEDGWVLVKTYSDQGMKIMQLETGVLYDEAIDPKFTNREYEETNIPIETPESEDEEIPIEPYILKESESEEESWEGEN